MRTTQKLLGEKFSVEVEVCGDGEPLLFLHGFLGLLSKNPFLEELGRSFRVIAPHLPGYGESTGAEHVDDVIDAALFLHELMDNLNISAANVVGHSMGAMLAAEVAALDVHRAKKLVLAAPMGLWLDDHPIPDLFATPMLDMPKVLFDDPKAPAAQAMTVSSTLPSLLGTMTGNIESTKRLGMASKFLYPIPYRGLKRRAYRIQSPTLILMGGSDRLVPYAYGEAFRQVIRNSTEQVIAGSGHMMPYEQPTKFCEAVLSFLRA